MRSIVHTPGRYGAAMPAADPAWLAGLVALTPHALSGGTVWDSTPAEWQGVSTPKVTRGIVGAWSGGCVDPVTRRLFFSGGGHSDGADNGIRVCDFRGNGEMSLMPGTISAFADIISDAPSDLYADGRPTAVHTYACMQYLPDGRIVRSGSASYGSGGGGASLFTYDPSVATDPGDKSVHGWDARTSSIAGPSSVLYLSPDGTKLLQFGTLYQPRFIDIATWAQTPYGSGIWGGTLDHSSNYAHDTSRNRYWMIGRRGTTPYTLQSKLVTINWAGNTYTWADQALTGDSADVDSIAGGMAVFYDAARDSYWTFGSTIDMTSGSIGYMLEIDAATFSVTRHTLASPVTCGTYNRGTYSRFIWMADWRVFGTVVDYQQPAVVIKIPT